MPNPENIVKHNFKPGESGNPKGRPKGAKNKRTMVRDVLSLSAVMPNAKFTELKKLYPDIDNSMSAAEVMTIAQISKAIVKSDTAAYKAVMDYAPDDIGSEDEAEKAARYIGIRDSVIDKHYRFLNEEHDWTILEGGSRSGKTYNFLLWAFMQTLKGKFDLNIIAPSFKMLELGSFVDLKNILSAFAPDIKIPERATKIDLYNGSRWTFEVVTNENEAKRNRVNVFVNEADGIPKKVANLLGRASGRKFIDFNPVRRFWAHDKINDERTNILTSTWTDNPFLSTAQLQWFEDLKTRGENAPEGSPEKYAYDVYYLGDYSILSGKAFELSDFNIVNEVPETFDYYISYSDPSLGVGADYFAGIFCGIKKKQVYVLDVIFSQYVKVGGYIETLKEWDVIADNRCDHYAESNGVSGVVTKAVSEIYQRTLSTVNNTSKKDADIIVYSSVAKNFKYKAGGRISDFLKQCADFPNSQHDDAPDALSRGAKLIQENFDIL